jgi:16S rRNA (cytidine1402-2'-O)-methyltransferase
MHKDENLNKLKPGLYCVATPIGNLGDITFRALETIKNSDLILCEDTRVSKKLLDKFRIKKRLISNHKFNEKKNLKMILGLLENKKIISLISDAGTPAISDPGRILVNECKKKTLIFILFLDLPPSMRLYQLVDFQINIFFVVSCQKKKSN